MNDHYQQASYSERQRKKKLDRFLLKHNRTKTNEQPHFYDNDSNNNHSHNQYKQKESYRYKQEEKRSHLRQKNRLFPHLDDRRRSYDLGCQDHRKKKEEYEKDKTELYLRNCQDIINNLRELKNKKKKLGQKRFSTQDARGKEHQYLLDDVYRPNQNNGFKSQGTAYNKVLPPLEVKYKANLEYNKSRRYYGEQTETPSGLPEYKKVGYDSQSISSFKYSQKEDSRLKTEISKEKETLATQRQNEDFQKNQEKFIDCITQLTRFLKQQSKRKESNKSSIRQSRIDSQHRHRNNLAEVGSKYNPEQTKTKNFNNLVQQANEALQGMNKQKQKSVIIDSSRSKFTMEENKIENNSSKEDERLPSRRSHFGVKLQSLSQRSDKFSINNIDGIAIEPSKPEKASKDEMVRELMTHLQKQDERSQELSYCLRQLTSYLSDQNEHSRVKQQSVYSQSRNTSIKSVEQDPKEMENTVFQASAEKTQNEQNSLIQASKQEKQSEDIEKQQDSMECERPHANIQQSVIKGLKKARLRGFKFTQKLLQYKKKHPQTKNFNKISADQRQNNSLKGQTEPTEMNNSKPISES